MPKTKPPEEVRDPQGHEDKNTIEFREKIKSIGHISRGMKGEKETGAIIEGTPVPPDKIPVVFSGDMQWHSPGDPRLLFIRRS